MGTTDDIQVFSDRVLGTTVSISELKKKIRAAFGTRAIFGPNFNIERIGENQGFLSITVRLRFDWVGGAADENLPDSLVLKIPSTSAMLRNVQPGPEDVVREQHARLAMILSVGHISEVSFYRLAEREALYDKLRIPRCRRAQHFRRNGSEAGYLLLDDVRRATVQPLYAGLREPQVNALIPEKIIKQLAKLHAFSLINGSWQRGSQKVFRSTFYEVQRAYADITRVRIARAILQLSRDFGFWFVDAGGRNLLEALADLVDDQLRHGTGELVHAALAMPSVLVHGDLWTNNVLWAAEDNGAASDDLRAIIDWQNVHPGNVAEDLVRLLGSSCSPKLRRGGLHRFVSRYMTCLNEELQLSRTGVANPFTHKQIVCAYERLFGQGLLIMLPSLNAAADEGNGLLGEDNQAEHQATILDRTRALIEDLVLYRAKYA